jgi:hypothetical protein
MNHGATRRALVLIIATAVAVAACGSEDGDEAADDSPASVDEAADTPIGQAIADEMMTGAEGDLVATEEQARCASGTIVDGIGEDRLAELGITPDSVGGLGAVDFTDDEIDVVVDAVYDCADVREQLAAELAADFGDEAADCLADQLDEDFMKGLLRTNFDDTASDEAAAEFFQQFLDIAAECDVALG